MDMLQNKKVTLPTTIAIYDNQTLLNKYENKEEFFLLYEQLKNKIREKQRELKLIDEQELSRIVKEFDYKNYAQRYKTDCGTVLAALFGAFNAEREIIRNGLKKK